MTLKFELGLDFLTVHLPTKFHRPMFNRLEIVLTKVQTRKLSLIEDRGQTNRVRVRVDLDL